MSEEIEDLLKRSLPDVPTKDIQRAAEAITEAEGEWHEVDLKEETLGAEISVQCKDICVLGEAFDKGFQIRAFFLKGNV